MIWPIERTILQSVRNVLFDSGCEILNIRIREPGIFESTDIETELFNHRLHASNAQLYVRVSWIDLIGGVTTDKEIGN
jgi:hypothetical protein